MDRGSWLATVHGVRESQTQWSDGVRVHACAHHACTPRAHTHRQSLRRLSDLSKWRGSWGEWVKSKPRSQGAAVFNLVVLICRWHDKTLLGISFFFLVTLVDTLGNTLYKLGQTFCFLFFLKSHLLILVFRHGDRWRLAGQVGQRCQKLGHGCLASGS